MMSFDDAKVAGFVSRMRSIPRKAIRCDVYGDVSVVVDRRHAQAIIRKCFPLVSSSDLTAAVVAMQDRLDERYL